MLKIFYNWLFNIQSEREKVELLFVDLFEEHGKIETMRLEGKSRFGHYHEDEVYQIQSSTKGPYTYLHWVNLLDDVEFICDVDSVTVHRSEEVLREI